MDDKRAKELIEMNEEEASNLPRDKWYDRVILIRQKIGMDMIAKYKIANISYSGQKNESSGHFWGPGHPTWDSMHADKIKK